jgi:hypothetical protein
MGQIQSCFLSSRPVREIDRPTDVCPNVIWPWAGVERREGRSHSLSQGNMVWPPIAVDNVPVHRSPDSRKERMIVSWRNRCLVARLNVGWHAREEMIVQKAQRHGSPVNRGSYRTTSADSFVRTNAYGSWIAR